MAASPARNREGAKKAKELKNGKNTDPGHWRKCFEWPVIGELRMEESEESEESEEFVIFFT